VNTERKERTATASSAASTDVAVFLVVCIHAGIDECRAHEIAVYQLLVF
jgi:hypothetical protein